MSDQETITLIVAVVAASIAILLINLKAWRELFMVIGFAVIIAFFVAYLDAESPREPNQSTLEQLREKWRGKEGEPVDGSSS